VSTLVVLLTACQPAYQLDLVGTQWSIQSIDGTSIDTPTAVLRFGSDRQAADDAVLSLACGDVPLAWVWDTDGSALSLLPGEAPETCRQGVAPGDSAVLDAIGGVESWSVQGHDQITLKGERELRLVRIASS
jgi:META domain